MTPITTEWVEKSDNDLAGARALAALGDAVHADVIVYLCQQSVEKAMKGLMIERGVVPPKTHNLVDLGQLLVTAEPRWHWDAVELKRITDGAVEYRYPGITATLQEARDALALSERIRNAAIALI